MANKLFPITVGGCTIDGQVKKTVYLRTKKGRRIPFMTRTAPEGESFDNHADSVSLVAAAEAEYFGTTTSEV